MPAEPAAPHHRRSIRLPGYDYAGAGWYFVTICTHGRECMFGEIVNGVMVLNDLGKIVHGEWNQTSMIRPTIELGEFVVMPNHFHGIIVIHESVGAYGDTPVGWGVTRKGTACRAPTRDIPTYEQFGKPVAGSIPTIVRSFKSAVTRQINLILNTPGAPVWQRNYYEHIIRNENSYLNITQYIRDNPANWESDTLFTAGMP